MRDVLSLPHGEQPARVAADPQREGVEELTYEAYEEAVVPKFAEIVAEARRR